MVGRQKSLEMSRNRAIYARNEAFSADICQKRQDFGYIFPKIWPIGHIFYDSRPTNLAQISSILAKNMTFMSYFA